MLCARIGTLDIAKLLVGCGCDVFAHDAAGNTALSLAQEHGWEALASYLINNSVKAKRLWSRLRCSVLRQTEKVAVANLISSPQSFVDIVNKVAPSRSRSSEAFSSPTVKETQKNRVLQFPVLENQLIYVLLGCERIHFNRGNLC